jgi:hypothetical protein
MVRKVPRFAVPKPAPATAVPVRRVAADVTSIAVMVIAVPEKKAGLVAEVPMPSRHSA